MKNKTILFLIASIMTLSVLLSSCTNSYYPDMETARNEAIKYYKNIDCVLSVEAEANVIDFAYSDGEIHMFRYVVSRDEEKAGYIFRSVNVKPLDRYIDIAEIPVDSEYKWTDSKSGDTILYKWCIVTEEFNLGNDSFPSYKFEHNGVKYNLCYSFDGDILSEETVNINDISSEN